MGFCLFPTRITPSKHKSVLRQRQTVAKQVKSLATHDINAAYLLARRGRKFTELEENLNIYYFKQQELRTMKSGKRIITDPVMEKIQFPWTKQKIALENRLVELGAETERLKLCKIVMDAIDNHDSKKVFEIARAIEFLKNFEESGDAHRARLLHWKQILDAQGGRWPIRKVAEAVAWPDIKSRDGFSRLRRLCKE